MIAAALGYTFGKVELAGLAWQHRNSLPNGKNPTTNAWALGGVWTVLPQVRLVAEVGAARDDGTVYATGARKARGKDTYLNFGTTYSFSKHTHVYARVGRTADENGGFNGRPSLAAPSVKAGMPLPANMSVRGVTVGFRVRF